EPAAAGQGLGEGAHAQVDAVLDPEESGLAGPPGAEEPTGGGPVAHQAAAVPAGGAANARRRGPAAPHREDPIDAKGTAAAASRSGGRGIVPWSSREPVRPVP